MDQNKLSPARTEDDIYLLGHYRQIILEVIQESNPDKASENAKYWMKKFCDIGCEIHYEHDTSIKILEDILNSLKPSPADDHSLYNDSSFFV